MGKEADVHFTDPITMTPDQLKDALGYGAGAVLAIECRTNKMRVSRVINGTCRDATIESAIRAYLHRRTQPPISKQLLRRQIFPLEPRGAHATGDV